MPRRDDLHKILVLGSGPIVIGQAAEFDYSGAQACKVLLEEGYEVVLINSNPATIMTDPELADRTYVEPLDLRAARAIVEKERPSAILPTLGGQTGLNLALALHDLAGVHRGTREHDLPLVAEADQCVAEVRELHLFLHKAVHLVIWRIVYKQGLSS